MDMMKIVMVGVDVIHPYAKNAKNHDKKQIKNISKSIEQYGWTKPIVLDRNNEIVIGHGRYFAAQQLKLKEVPCVYVENLSDEQVRALRIADNKLNESSWDLKTLADELEGLDFGNIELDFDMDVNVKKVREDNYDPQPPKEPKAKLGDVYRLGRHRLMCGDSTVLSDVEKLCDGAGMDMLLTDPPYNVALGTGGMYQSDDGHAGAHDIKENGAFLLNDDLPDEEFRQFLVDAFSNAQMVMKKGAAFHIWHADSERYNFESAVRLAGLVMRQTLIWVKNRATLSRQDFQWQHEPALYGEKILPYGETEEYGNEHETCTYGWIDGAGHYWFKNRKQCTVLYFDRPTTSKEHPTMKPILLFDYEMKCNTLVDENVLDLFGGSGTTIMAAEQNGRKAFVMEYDPKFVDVIIHRWLTFTGRIDDAVLIHEDGTEEPIGHLYM